MAGLKNVALRFFICSKVARIRAPGDKENEQSLWCALALLARSLGEKVLSYDARGTHRCPGFVLCPGSDSTVGEQTWCKGCTERSFWRTVLNALISEEKGLLYERHAAVRCDKVQVYSSLSLAFSLPQIEAKMHSCNLLWLCLSLLYYGKNVYLILAVALMFQAHFYIP